MAQSAPSDIIRILERSDTPTHANTHTHTHTHTTLVLYYPPTSKIPVPDSAGSGFAAAYADPSTT